MAKQIDFYDFHPTLADFKTEVLGGLSRSPRHIPPKFFYDREGSRLFDAITELPEYYPTVTEIRILRQHGKEIAAHVGRDALLLELGSGSSRKIRTLLDALAPAVYMPIDISREHLMASAQDLSASYPALEVHAACADYSSHFALPYSPPDDLRRAAFFPGSSIGNFDPADAAAFLRRIAAMVGEGGRLLIGVDLKKDRDRLEAAYNDSRGVTAAFNLNLLRRINRELSGDFDTEAFSHRAFYDAEQGRIEMHLVSRIAQIVTVAGRAFRFAAGQTVHTENSYKFTVDEFQRLASESGFEPECVWTDDDGLFSVHCLRSYGTTD
ncbi:MAG: L-histidine N(alpha)-methyltransferase [Gammaproteobacteria bacterium]|jgi:dimethylhistidine N-methyltransferase|nr:L-histidine N(alpha)-methyltransferase [Gammaproteobacteria bacterium]